MRSLFAGRSYASVARGAGISELSLSLFCRGRASNPTTRTLERIAAALGCSVVALFEAARALRPKQPGVSQDPPSPAAPRQPRRATAQTLPLSVDRTPPRPAALRPSLQRLLAPPAPFLPAPRPRHEMTMLSISGRGEDNDDNDTDGYVWDDD